MYRSWASGVMVRSLSDIFLQVPMDLATNTRIGTFSTSTLVPRTSLQPANVAISRYDRTKAPSLRSRLVADFRFDRIYLVPASGSSSASPHCISRDDMTNALFPRIRLEAKFNIVFPRVTVFLVILRTALVTRYIRRQQSNLRLPISRQPPLVGKP